MMYQLINHLIEKKSNFTCHLIEKKIANLMHRDPINIGFEDDQYIILLL